MDDPRPAIDEALLAESAEDLYETAPCGYLTSLPDGTIVRVNGTLASWLGYERAELVNRKRFQDLLTLPGKIYVETHYAPLLLMQGAVKEIAFDLVRRDGRLLPVLINSSLRRDPSGNPLLSRAMVFDATDRRRYERELLLARRKAEHAVEAKARQLAMITHEIRSPLNTISLLIAVLQRMGGPPAQEEPLKTLESASRHLADLVNALLDHGKLEAGKMALDRRRFSVRELVQSVVARLGPRADDKKLALALDLDPDLPAISLGDPLKLDQVLTNLITNAVKFTQAGTVQIRVRVLERSSGRTELEFSVADTGIGIPPDRLESIFEEFVQAAPDTAARFGGTGLGLTITRRLLRLFDSDVTVRSVLGEGSRFTFRLALTDGALEMTGA